ncbi:MAG TPA: leukotriene A4 hydrolase C-terminal domain-containing protein [Thermoanaerobaculia bacterium]|nr:leukotriene A4 hydrolase C-terminal domain-containing protein [Thermoanaerobaculia bacterium]
MLQRRIVLALFTFVLLVNARQRAVGHREAWPFTGAPADVFSYAEPAKITTRHMTLDLTVDFTTEQLRGRATLDIENRAGTRTLVLDTYELAVSRVLLDGATPAEWSFGEATPMGRPLRVTIEPTTRSVSIDYETSAFAAPMRDSFGPALRWTPPEETVGDAQPYVYTLTAPIGARSWMPVQDTPTVRMTYDATLRVPRGMLALMSAANNPKSANETGIYVFRMPYRIPSYLIAFAVGRLAFHEFDERTGVYAEPELIAAAAHELQSLPRMLEIAEEIAGPFPFSRHDVLIAPPTFPFGGMEHPMLNIVHPLSSVSGHFPETPAPRELIAHELAHSWAGDATTLATWDDVWLNEGVTTYLAHRIMEELQGPEMGEYAWSNELEEYASVVDRLTENTALHYPVAEAKEGFSQTSYGKGALFVRTLEDHAGRERFDAFLKMYFQWNRWWWVDEQKFAAQYRSMIHPDETQLRLNEWLYEGGLPSNVSAPATSGIRTRVEQRVNAFNSGTPIGQLAPATWTETELGLFLQTAQVRPNMAKIDAALSLSASDTPPLKWLTDSARSRYEPGMVAVERVLLRGTPYSWMNPIYRALNEVDRERARAVFQRSRANYYPLMEKQIGHILGVATTGATGSQPVESNTTDGRRARRSSLTNAGVMTNVN